MFLLVFDPSKYKTQTSKPLPVVLLLDVSGSMRGEKIDALNNAIRTMLHDFKCFKDGEQEILVSVITFGEAVQLHMPYTKAKDAESQWQDLTAYGGTPLGTALKMAKDIIEDKSMTPSPCKKIHAILVSDGKPDKASWEAPMEAFINTGRSRKALRMAMAIGDDANENMLSQFIKDSNDIEGNPIKLFHADDVADIQKFFNLVTMSTEGYSKGVPEESGPSSSSNTAEDDDIPLGM